MKLSKEQKELAIQKISNPYGSVDLMCDGSRITLAVERTSKLAYRVITYVDGVFNGVWCMVDSQSPESKFLRKVNKPVCSPIQKKKMEKIMGKRRFAADPYYSKIYICYMPDWASGKAAINHLCRVCESVELIEKS